MLAQCLFLSLSIAAGFLVDEAELSADTHENELRAHVYRLSSPEFVGRRGPGAARASKHIAEMFKAIGLRPAFGDSYFQPIPWREKNEPPSEANFAGRNVAGLIPGTDEKLKDEWIVVSAHFDHLGQLKNGLLCPDDISAEPANGKLVIGPDLLHHFQ